MTLCNRAVSELIFLAAAFALYFLAGIFFMDLETPAVSGIVLYIVCMLFFSIMCFMLGHAIAAFALLSAVGSVLLEWYCPIRGWKIESDLWHHPRKYIVPAAMLLLAGLVGMF